MFDDFELLYGNDQKIKSSILGASKDDKVKNQAIIKYDADHIFGGRAKVSYIDPSAGVIFDRRCIERIITAMDTGKSIGLKDECELLFHGIISYRKNKNSGSIEGGDKYLDADYCTHNEPIKIGKESTDLLYTNSYFQSPIKYRRTSVGCKNISQLIETPTGTSFETDNCGNIDIFGSIIIYDIALKHKRVIQKKDLFILLKSVFNSMVADEHDEIKLFPHAIEQTTDKTYAIFNIKSVQNNKNIIKNVLIEIDDDSINYSFLSDNRYIADSIHSHLSPTDSIVTDKYENSFVFSSNAIKNSKDVRYKCNNRYNCNTKMIFGNYTAIKYEIDYDEEIKCYVSGPLDTDVQCSSDLLCDDVICGTDNKCSEVGIIKCYNIEAINVSHAIIELMDGDSTRKYDIGDITSIQEKTHTSVEHIFIYKNYISAIVYHTPIDKNNNTTKTEVLVFDRSGSMVFSKIFGADKYKELTVSVSDDLVFIADSNYGEYNEQVVNVYDMRYKLLVNTIRNKQNHTLLNNPDSNQMAIKTSMEVYNTEHTLYLSGKNLNSKIYGIDIDKLNENNMEKAEIKYPELVIDNIEDNSRMVYIGNMMQAINGKLVSSPVNKSGPLTSMILSSIQKKGIKESIYSNDKIINDKIKNATENDMYFENKLRALDKLLDDISNGNEVYMWSGSNIEKKVFKFYEGNNK